MTFDLLARLGDWNWFVLGLLLLGIEIVAPGTFMLWLGVAALTTGVLAVLTDWSWQAQGLAFAVLALVAVAGWWRLAAPRRPDRPAPVLHRRADMHIGREFLLAEPIAGGYGRLRIDDTLWRVHGPDMPAGAKVLVTATDGPLLIVRAA